VNVRRWGRRIALAVASVPLALGCADPDVVCTTDKLGSPNPDAVYITAPERMGEVLLSAETLTFNTRFELELDGLPEVWVGENPVGQPSLDISFELDYADPQPAGAELPEVTAVLDSGRTDNVWSAVAQATTVLGGKSGAPGSLSVAPFAVCTLDSGPDCCPYGASRCEGMATLALTRAADLFPPVRIRYSGTPGISVYTCLEGERTATWTFEETAP